MRLRLNSAQLGLELGLGLSLAKKFLGGSKKNFTPLPPLKKIFFEKNFSSKSLGMARKLKKIFFGGVYNEF